MCKDDFKTNYSTTQTTPRQGEGGTIWKGRSLKTVCFPCVFLWMWVCLTGWIMLLPGKHMACRGHLPQLKRHTPAHKLRRVSISSFHVDTRHINKTKQRQMVETGNPLRCVRACVRCVQLGACHQRSQYKYYDTLNLWREMTMTMVSYRFPSSMIITHQSAENSVANWWRSISWSANTLVAPEFQDCTTVFDSSNPPDADFYPLAANRRRGAAVMQTDEFELIALLFRNSVFVGSVHQGEQLQEGRCSQLMRNLSFTMPAPHSGETVWNDSLISNNPSPSRSAFTLQRFIEFFFPSVCWKVSDALGGFSSMQMNQRLLPECVCVRVCACFNFGPVMTGNPSPTTELPYNGRELIGRLTSWKATTRLCLPTATYFSFVSCLWGFFCNPCPVWPQRQTEVVSGCRDDGRQILFSEVELVTRRWESIAWVGTTCEAACSFIIYFFIFCKCI